MHPQALIDICGELVELVLKFDHPADSVVSRFFREHRALGPRERATLAETAYNVLRRKTLYEALVMGAPKGSGSKWRRLAILGFHGPRDFLKGGLNDAERAWIDACDKVDVRTDSTLLDLHRHNLPDWLVQPIKSQLGTDGFWSYVLSLIHI